MIAVQCAWILENFGDQYTNRIRFDCHTQRASEGYGDSSLRCEQAHRGGGAMSLVTGFGIWLGRREMRKTGKPSDPDEPVQRTNEAGACRDYVRQYNSEQLCKIRPKENKSSRPRQGDLVTV